ncbi:MAG: nucleoside triphosphate pyrophosphohydrolase [Magnetococcales bacterium]|nr:nucleoside triphosphate pyrophosphohydrolase [Magnetococcales bacterium]
MPSDTSLSSEAIQELETLMQRLRAPDGCPWDRKQTHHSLLPYTIEEAYEVAEGVESGDPAELKEELGDLLFHIVFHSEIARENGTFTLEEVIRHITTKMTNRHPHVFGSKEETLATPDQVVDQWEEIKRREKADREDKRSPQTLSVFDGLSGKLPALLWAHKVQRKMAKVNFDWTEIEPVWKKVHEELGELEEAHAQQDQEGMEGEFGDLLFVLVNLARHMNVNPEAALRRTTIKAQSRFRYIEEHLQQQDKLVEDEDLAALEELWQDSKRLFP